MPTSKRHHTKESPLPREGGGSHGLAPSDLRSVRTGSDLRLPWRVDDIERRYKGVRIYEVVDRLSVTVAFFLDLKAAELAVQSVNK